MRLGLIGGVAVVATMAVGTGLSHGASWTPATPLPKVPTKATPAITLAPNGSASAIVVRLGPRPRVLEVARRNRGSRLWRARASVRSVPKNRLETPEVEVDRRGRAIAAWADRRGIWTSVRRSPLGRWTPPLLVSGADRPTPGWGWDIEGSLRGTVLVTWHTDAGVRGAIGSTTGTFEEPVSIGGPGFRKAPPSAAVAADGSLVVVWTGERRETFLTARRPAEGDAFAEVPSIDVTDPGRPRLAVGRDGAAGLIYSVFRDFVNIEDLDFSEYKVLFHRLGPDDQRWSPARTIVAGDESQLEDAQTGGLVMDGSGRAIALVQTVDVTVPGNPEDIDVTIIQRGGTGRIWSNPVGFQFPPGAQIVPTRRGAAIGWYEQGEPGITKVPRLRETYVVTTRPGRNTPTKRRQLGGKRSELRGLYGGPGGAAALLREPRRWVVSLYRG